MIKVFSIKEDAPVIVVNKGIIRISLTMRNIIYLTIIAGFPALLFVISMITMKNLVITGPIFIFTIIVAWMLSSYRIDNTPIDLYLLNMIKFSMKKNKKEEFNIEDLTGKKKFIDIVNAKKNSMIEKIQ